MIELVGTRDTGVNYTHLTELLAEREEIRLSRSTVRDILMGAGIASPRQRRPPQHHCRQERIQQEGVLVQDRWQFSQLAKKPRAIAKTAARSR